MTDCQEFEYVRFPNEMETMLPGNATEINIPNVDSSQIIEGRRQNFL